MTDAERPLVQLLRSTELAGTAPYAYAATVSPAVRLIFTAGACPLDEQGRTVDTVTLRRGPRPAATPQEQSSGLAGTAVAGGAGLAVVAAGTALAVRRLRGSRTA